MGRTHRWLPLAVAGAVLVTATGIGALVLATSDADGPQPWQALPASAAGFVAVDLDPAVSQKLEALKIMKSATRSDKDAKTVLNDALLGGTSYGVPSARLTKWAGNRAAAAVAVGVAGSLIPTVMSVLEVDDAPAMRADLAELAKSRGPQTFGYATVGTHFVLVSTSQDAADALANEATTAPLSGTPAFIADMTALPKSRVGTLWADLELMDEAVAASPDNSKLPALAALPGMGSKRTTGRVVAAARFDDGVLELKASAHRWQVGGHPVAPTSGASSELLDTIPSDAVAAAGIAALGAHAEAWYNGLPQGERAQWDARAANLGLVLPGDLKAALGTQAALAMSSPAQPGTQAGYALRTSSADPVSAYRAVQSYGQQVAFPATGAVWDVQLAGASVVAGTDPDFVAKTVAGGSLGQQKRFKDVLPRTDDAALLAWADLPKLASALAEPLNTPLGTLTLPPNASDRIADLGPVGVWVGKSTADGDAQMQVRFALR